MPRKGESGLTPQQQADLILKNQADLKRLLEEVLRELRDNNEKLTFVFEECQKDSFDLWPTTRSQEGRPKLPFER